MPYSIKETKLHILRGTTLLDVNTPTLLHPVSGIHLSVTGETGYA